MGLKWLIFLTIPLLLGYEICDLYEMVSTSKSIEVIATIFIIFGAHMNILLFIKVKILKLIKWSYRFPTNPLTIMLAIAATLFFYNLDPRP